MESLNATGSEEELTKMKPSSPSPFSSFKSKKILRSTTKSPSSDEIQPSDPKTPMKPMQLRSRNRGVAFSLNQVKNAAQSLNKSNTKKPVDDLDLIESSTPVKKSPKKKADKSPIKLPERYELLAKFFDQMQSTMRLMKLKGIMRSFTNICPSVECLSDRRFTYTHLAQMKYILPEAIELKKIVVADQKTCCTKSDLEVLLLPSAIESDGKGNTGGDYCNLSKVFRTRLLEFCKANPQEDEIPMGELPEPFNKRVQNSLSSEQNCTSLPVPSSSNVLPPQRSIIASHLPLSFKTRFAQKAPMSEAEKTQLLSTSPSSSCQLEEADVKTVIPGSVTSSPRDLFPRLDAINAPKPVEICNKETEVVLNNDYSRNGLLHSKSNVIPSEPASAPTLVSNTPEKPINDKHKLKVAKNKDCSSNEIIHPEGTPAKPISTPMTVTPVLQTPKRCHIIQDVAATPSPNKLARRPPKRPLFNTPIKSTKAPEINEMEKSSSDSYLTKLLPEALRQSLMVKESKATKAQDIAISQAKRRKQMIACLPNLFNMIHLMFQSVNSCVITKEELLYKIIRSHQDITDRGELEEQLKLLKELVPDWIQEKVASSGDLLFRINKRSCPDLVRRRLKEAL